MTPRLFRSDAQWKDQILSVCITILFSPFFKQIPTQNVFNSSILSHTQCYMIFRGRPSTQKFMFFWKRGGGHFRSKNYIADFVGFKAVYFGRKFWKNVQKGGRGGGHRQSKKFHCKIYAYLQIFWKKRNVIYKKGRGEGGQGQKFSKKTSIFAATFTPNMACKALKFVRLSFSLDDEVESFTLPKFTNRYLPSKLSSKLRPLRFWFHLVDFPRYFDSKLRLCVSFCDCIILCPRIG